MTKRKLKDLAFSGVLPTGKVVLASVELHKLNVSRVVVLADTVSAFPIIPGFQFHSPIVCT